MSEILLCTLNARYTHSSLALRYLFANLKELQGRAKILEFTINEKIQDIAETLLDFKPKIITIGVYIWNASQVYELLHILKKLSSSTKIILGGPEVSYEPFRVDFSMADYIIQGEGDVAVYELCRALYDNKAPKERMIKAKMVDLQSIELPYAYYSDEDIKNRYIYVEASRGCPFLCEFCLSSIDEKVRNFEINRLLDAFEELWQRGVRSFKFIDRTFNVNVSFAIRILDFFLAKNEPFFAHFEVIPDHFPQKIKEKIARFPKGSIQLEIGIQTLKKDISDNISRPLRLEKIKENLSFLEHHTQVHMHVDLIVGLPGEDLKSFAENLNLLYSMTKCEIQIGILKKLSGTVMNRHDEAEGMIYSDIPPYDVLATRVLSYKELANMKRFARFWDLYYNSGNFQSSMPMLFEADPFENFYRFSLWIYTQTQATWKIALDRLAQLLFEYLTHIKNLDKHRVMQAISDDFSRVAGHKVPKFLRQNGSIKKVAKSAPLKRQHKRIDV